MKWCFCKVNNNDYYFGEVTNSMADGLGIYFINFDQYFHGSWEQGILKDVYILTNQHFTPKTAYNVINIEPKYNIPEVYSENYPIGWSNKIVELLHEESSADFPNYSIQNFTILDLRKATQIIKSLHFKFKFNDVYQTINIHCILVVPQSPVLEFQILVDRFYNPWEELKNITDAKKKFDAYWNLVNILKKLHNDSTVHDDIHPGNIAAIKKNNEVLLVFNDFSRAQSLKKLPNIFDYKIPSILTRSREFRAPETFNSLEYNPFLSDAFSLGMTICAFELGFKETKTINQEFIQNIRNRIGSKSSSQRNVQEIISPLLDFDPSTREKISLLNIDTTVH